MTRDVDPAGPDEPAVPDAAPASRPTWKDPVVLVAAVLVLVPTVVAMVSALRHPYAPTNDWALIELKVRAVGTGDTPLVGAWSRFGWDHPGPWPFWLLAPFYRLVPPEHGLLFSAAALNFLATAGCAAVALRRPRAQALVVLVGLAVLLRGLGVSGLSDPWNPTLPVLPFALYCLACIEMAIAPRRWMLPLAAATGSFAVQAHIGFLQPVLLVGATTAGLVWWRRRHAAPTAAEPVAGSPAGPTADATADGAPAPTRRPWWRAGLPTAIVLAVAWLPVVIDQVAGSGNVGTIVRWAAGDDLGRGPNVTNDGRLGLGEIVRGASWLLHPVGLWLGEFTPIESFGLELLGRAAPVLLLWIPAALVAAVLLARWSPPAERWATVCVAAVAGGASLAVVADLVTARGAPVAWPFRWAGVAAMLVWVALGWAVTAAVAALRSRAPREARTARWVGGLTAAGLAAGVTAVVAVTVWRGSVGVRPEQAESDALLRLLPAIEDATRGQDVVAANSTVMFLPADLGVPVLLERLGVDWIEWDDPRAQELTTLNIIDQRAMAGLTGMRVASGGAAIVARSGPLPGQPSENELLLMVIPPADGP